MKEYFHWILFYDKGKMKEQNNYIQKVINVILFLNF